MEAATIQRCSGCGVERGENSPEQRRIWLLRDDRTTGHNHLTTESAGFTEIVSA
jgi:hypothetical protein